MKKSICITSIMLVAICFCSCIKTSDINIKNMNAQSIKEHIENGDIDLENILDDDKHLIVILQDSIVINDKKSNKTRSVKYSGANSVCTSQNKLYFFDRDKKSINSLDLEKYKIKKEYSAYSPMQQFYCIGNENILIESQDDTQFIYNTGANKKYDTSDSDAYIGTDYYIDNKKTGVFINDRHIENLGYISDICRIGDDLFYKSDIEESKATISRLSAKSYKKSVVLQFDMSEKDKYISKCPKGLYNYNDRLFIYVGINQKADSSSDYEQGEFWELDFNGKIKKKYNFCEIPDSSTFTFYDGRLFFYNINDTLNSITL